VSLLRLHPFDPRRKSRSVEIGAAGGVVLAALALVSGGVTALGLAAAPRLVSDLVHAGERRDIGETARRGAEAFASVGRRALSLGARIAADEVFLARVAAVIEVRPPAGFPGDPPGNPAPNADALESAVSELARRTRVLEIFRRSLSALPAAEPGGFRTAAVPSRSPVEPSTAEPISTFGPHESPITHEPDFETGITLASPAGAPVTATAEGTVLQAGRVSHRADARWRRLGVVVVLLHDARTRTVYGNLGAVSVRRGQRVGRGQTIGKVGTSGFAPTPRVHYEVQRVENGRWVSRDPRVFILDQDWIGAAGLRQPPQAPEAPDLPAERR
jgi:murein DD-endopeptidase MepM/ murein hydrolase activator NlpD